MMTSNDDCWSQLFLRQAYPILSYDQACHMLYGGRGLPFLY